MLMRFLPLVLSGVFVAAGAPVQRLDPGVRELTSAAAQYLADYEQQFSFLLADEVYTQQVVAGPTDGPDRRRMTGESFLTFLPGDRVWIAIHDIAEVDGHPVDDREDLKLLLQHEPVAGVARVISARNARFNIGHIFRNFNEPTLGLLVLDPRRQPQFKFTRRNLDRDGAVTLATLAFKETDAPTIVHGTDGREVFSTGEIVLEAGAGRIRRTSLQFKFGAITAALTTEFALDPKLAMWVPSIFNERYEKAGRGRELVVGEARYTNYRRFEVNARIK